MRRLLRILVRCVVLVVVFLAMAAGGTLGYFHYAPPEKTCISCHEIESAYNAWAGSAHRQILCRECHGGSLASGLHGLEENVRRVVGHFSEGSHDEMRLSEEQVIRVSERCGACHQKEHADWAASGHAATYATIFLDPSQNQREQINADCLRCHGMFFEGTVADVVEPLDVKGPWRLKREELAGRPAIPCLACHAVHAPGSPVAAARAGPATRPVVAPMAHFYMRQEKAHLPIDLLPTAAMKLGEAAIPVASDPRQRLCMQCHAPNAAHQAGTSDDRTPRGVHAGLSCAACHDAHSGAAQASCANCHPRLSNCGIDVTEMDTTFRDAGSRNNVHSVMCEDCHGG